MKFLATIQLFFALTASAQTPDDIIFQTRVQKQTLNWLIEKTRLIMGNAQAPDLLLGEVIIEKQPTFSFEEITANDPESLKMRNAFAGVFKNDVDLRNAVLRLRVPRVYYQIEQLLLNPDALNVVDPALQLKVTANLIGLFTRLTEGLQADLMVPNHKTGKMESYLTATIDPISLNIPKDFDPMTFSVDFETIRDQGFQLKLKGYDVTQLPGYVERNKSRLSILSVKSKQPVSADEIKVNPVIVRLNSMTRTVNFDSFKPIIQKNMNRIVGEILSLIGTSLQNSIGPRILTTIFSNKTTSGMASANDFIFAKYAVEKFAQPAKDQLLLGVQGSHCTATAYKELKEKCIDQAKETYEPVRTLSEEDQKKGMDELRDTLSQGKQDLAISISEEYLNRLIKTTVDAELFDKKLEEEKLYLGPKGVFTVFNKRSQGPEMFIDLLYAGNKGVEKVFINQRRPIRFPLRMATSIKFELKEGSPHLVIKVDKILSDKDEILSGIPEYELPSKLVRLFRKKIAGMILKMAAKMENTVVLDMDFPTLKGVGVENTTYEVSPYGRLNWFFKL